MPTTRMATISSVVATGRRTNMRDGFMCWPAGSQPRSRRPTTARSAAARPAESAGRSAEATLAVAATAGTGEFARLVLVFGLRQGPRLGHFRRRRIRQLDLGALAQTVTAIG